MNVIFFHINCMDGLAAAWAVWNHFNNDDIRTRHQGVRYDESMPEFADGDDVFIVDFSYSPHEIVKASQKARTLTLIDHHGGGGHKNAAGFSVNPETFFRLMDEACVLSNS